MCRMRPEAALILVKTVHTIVWAFCCVWILALPVVALAGHFRLAAWAQPGLPRPEVPPT